MMSMSLELLPTLNEGDEHVSLGDILAIRDTCLTELELWAVCKECCLAIQGVHVSSDMFQTLCITPDSLAFDQSGTVFFLDLYTDFDNLKDPEPMYVPPEYESVGNSYKAHLYSLGMTLLFAAEYNVAMESSRPFSTDLGHTINRMTLDDFDERASLEFVLDMCTKHLTGYDSDCVCQQIVSIAQSDTSLDDENFTNEVDDILSEKNYEQSDSNKSSPQHHLQLSSSPKKQEVDTSLPQIQSKNNRKRASPTVDNLIDDLATETILPDKERLDASGVEQVYNSSSTVLLHPNQIISSESDGGGVIVYQDDSSTPRKLSKKSSMVSPIQKKDPLESILGNSLDKVPSEDDLKAIASLEDIKFLTYVEPPLSNDLDLKQWDMLFPLPPPLSCKPQSVNPLQTNQNVNSISTDASFDEDILNVSSENVSKSEEINTSNLGEDKELHNPPKVGVLDTNNTNSCQPNQSMSLSTPSINTSTNVIDKMNGEVCRGNNNEPGHNNDNNRTDKGKNVSSTNNPNNSIENSSLNTHNLQIKLDENNKNQISQSEESIRTSTKVDKVVKDNTTIPPTRKQEKSLTEKFSHNIEKRGYRNKNKPQSPLIKPVIKGSGRVLEGPVNNLSQAEVLVNNRENLNSSGFNKGTLGKNSNLVLEGITNSSEDSNFNISTSGGVSATIAFNAVFGKQVHRDTSQDTLSLANVLDICNNQSATESNSNSKDSEGDLDGLVNRNTQQQTDDTVLNNNVCEKDNETTIINEHDDSIVSGDLNAESEKVTSDSNDETDNILAHVKEGSSNKTAMDTTNLMTTNGLRKRSKEKARLSNQVGQSVMQVLERLGCGLHENEVWALCRECVLSMQRNRLQLPAYVSLETVVIEDTGRVTYKPVPEDKELEVVFLAPELQQYGVVTEKTCLFGVAAMLWSAADYRLPSNQEPALSVDLENLLISMTQDDSDLRPTAIEVLQTCNEFQKKQNTTSTHICLSLASEARKALAFGKENSLVQNIIDEKIENDVKTQKAEVGKMIIRDQVTLKPASNRPIVELVKEKNLHEQLMEQIQKPPRKLRKSSKPKVQPVTEIFINNKDYMEGLQKITGKRGVITDEPSSISGIHNDGQSAFNSKSFNISNDSEVSNITSQVPNEFKSTATHFSPIVLSEENKKSQDQNLPTKPKSKIDEEKINEKIKKLKKNLLKNRLPLTLAADLEKEVINDNVQSPGSTKQFSSPSPHNMNLGSPHSTVMSSPGTIPTSPAANLYQSQFYAGQGQIPISTSVPNLAYPQYAPMAAAPMPFGMQMQLQQDPRTGLFQLVPVATAMPMAVPMQPTMYPNGGMNQLSVTPTGQFNNVPGIPVLPKDEPNRSFSPPSGSSTDGEKPERRRYRKKHHKQPSSTRHSDSDSGSRSSNRNSNDSNSSYKTINNNSTNKQDCDQEVDEHLNHGAGHQGSNNGNKLDLSPVLELRAPVPRASSVDLLERYENGNSQPRTPRNVKMKNIKNKIKRAKSGSSVDFKNENNDTKDVKSYEIYDDSGIECTKNISSHLSKSHPNLSDSMYVNSDSQVSHHKPVHKTRAQRRKTDPASPELPSPPLSPSLSKDSGVSGMNVKTSDMSLMERLLNSDTIRHQQKLSRVVRIVRDEFAYDGYMENGIEDLAMAEYILSLGNLKWDTFYNAVTEKYCDLYFEEDVMTSLFEAVNGNKPVQEKRSSRTRMHRVAGNTASVISVDEPQHKLDCVNRSGLTNSDSPSAFRPIHGSSPKPYSSNSPSDNIYKPKPKKYQKSDFAHEGGNRYNLHDNGSLERNKSSSLHDLLVTEDKKGSGMLESSLKSRSQEDLLDRCGSSDEATAFITSNDPANLNSGSNRPNTKLLKPPRKNLVSSSNIQNTPINNQEKNKQQTFINKNNGALKQSNGNTIAGYHNNNNQMEDIDISTDFEHMSKLSYLVRQDSDTSSSKSHSRTSNVVKREDSTSSTDITIHSGLDGGRFQLPRGSIGSTESGDFDEPVKDTPATQLNSCPEVPRVARGSVIYYSAEMETRLRSDVKDMAAQIDVKTKESIESKMAELEQQMLMEHKNKKKTLKYYRKLVEATKSGKITNEHKAHMNKVGKQIDESNNRLDFLDSAKKHLEMLHAEQWGLDHTLLYALANCPGDSAMLLCACDNPLLQFQLLRSPRLGIEGQFLQAGTPEGLLSYMFAQHALSEGYIHQFFYCYRYFTTSRHLYRFLCDKITAATLSLGPDAQVPSKIKARAVDLMQVWMEGYYSVDFKDDSELMEDFSNFVQEQILPVDESAEIIIDVIDECKAGRHRDLYYPDFTSREDTNNNNNANEEVPLKKWESFKAALKLTPKSASSKQNKSTPIKSDTESPSSLQQPGKRSDAFTLNDYSAQALAEQLTLMQQMLFQRSHPVHYLNSKWIGITTALTNPVMHKSQSIQRLSGNSFEGDGLSLFTGELHGQDIIHHLIEHAQSVSYWVTAEVVSCNSPKSQTAVLHKLIYVAKFCQENRNFATCVAIVDGLENLIVRQLAAWKGLSSKCMTAMEELSSLKLFLKSDSLCLLQDKSKRHNPTVPSILFFLLHVQQLEIGGFTLANGMARWSKIKAIANVIDQIRVFKQHPYSYTKDLDLQQSILNRMETLSNQDLHSIAQHTSTIPNKISSSGRLSNAFKKMSKKMKGNTDF